MAARAVYDDGAHVVVAVEARKRVGHLAPEVRPHRIAFARPHQRDFGDAFAFINSYSVVLAAHLRGSLSEKSQRKADAIRATLSSSLTHKEARRCDRHARIRVVIIVEHGRRG